MNHHILPPLGVALASGALAPTIMKRARWAHEAPRLASAIWGALTVVFTASAALTLVQALLPMDSGHRLTALLTSCAPWSEAAVKPLTREDLASLSAAESGALLAAGAVLLLPGVALARELLRARRSRAHHARVLRMVGVPEPRLRATVLEHAAPAVYCLPGRAPQVVVSSGALRSLTPAQLEATLAHERAHIDGRHHLLVSAAEAFAACFGRLPLARCVRTEVPLLVEMAADDRALRRCSRDALATALYAMAVGQAAGSAVPREAFAAGGPSAVLRMRRILEPHRRGHPALFGAFTALAAVAAVTPLVAACCSFPG